MSGGLEHRECAEVLAGYALDALPEAEAARVKSHLDECRECRAELDWLRAGVEVLPASVPPVEPPPELKQRLMAIVVAEAELLQAAGARADQPERAPRRRRWPSLWEPRMAIGTLALCAAVAVALVLTLGGGSGTRTISAQTTLAGARASLRLRGTRADLVVAGLHPPAANHVDEIWVKRGSAAPSPAGTFVLSSGSVSLTRPVRAGDLVLVTVEPGRGTLAPTTNPVIVAKV